MRKNALSTWRIVFGLCLLLSAMASANAQISPGPLSRAHSDLEGAKQCLRCHGRGAGSAAMNPHCLDCHNEIATQIEQDLGLHGQEKMQDCARCHPEHAGVEFELISWEEGSPEQFDHRRTGWPLAGRHAALQCRDCHKAEFRKAPVARLLKRKDPHKSWLGLARDCLSCHEDYHEQTLDRDCAKCHGPARWKPARHFDHGRSAFPLVDKHVNVACEKCHLVPEGKTAPRYKPLPFAECSDCHDDVHRGRLGPRCAACHVVTGFEQVDRKAFDHSKTRYPLQGGHAALECATCHDPLEGWGDKPPFERCDSCHADQHAGLATLGGRAVDCAACHDDQRFTRSTFTVADHASSAYPLEGKHAGVECGKCHLKNPSGVSRLGPAGVLMRPTFRQCRDCHKDSHAGQLAERSDGGACEACHRVQGWKPTTFTAAEHAKLELSLQGRHLDVECASCHAREREGLPPLPGDAALGSAGVALTLIDADCASCHHDSHAGRFAASGAQPRSGCDDCHDSRRFRPSIVDSAVHDDFDYALEGAHRAIPCVLCHEELKAPPASIKLLRVEGSPEPLLFESSHEQCKDCHESPHGRQFVGRVDGGACEGCHVVDAFRPASRFDHDLDSAFSLKGAHQDVSCDRCHATGADEAGGPRVLYRPIPHRCQDCHRTGTPSVSGGMN